MEGHTRFSHPETGSGFQIKEKKTKETGVGGATYLDATGAFTDEEIANLEKRGVAYNPEDMMNRTQARKSGEQEVDDNQIQEIIDESEPEDTKEAA